ncbi:MAG: glycosyltransferase family 9 protein [Anaerovibrio sp.]|uniref:glycosyltransferase family 9 protein n=1 Tax=Anaerovibrio sp. TaxID=1872532 RepID=UPI0025DAE019|nr:glycosyltransferase family 9 protein [Anaerovibrio sp.]MCR5176519.1 glycosyltransferase family 9 protein [Anaerovibrio sp.]
MSDYNNILVINLMHIGDLMLVTPVLRTLRANYPKARLTLLADKKLSDLVMHNKWLDECLLLDKKGADNTLLALARFIGNIRRKRYDLVINLHRNERASAIAAFSGAKRIVGYSKPGFSLFFSKVMQNPSVAHHIGHGPFNLFPPRKYVPGWKHQVHAHLEVLKECLGIEKIDDGGLEMWIPEEITAKADKLWQDSFPKDIKVVAFNIGASWQTKRWLDSYFAQCADELLEKDYGIAFFGGPMDQELVEKCISQMKHKDSPLIRIFTGKLSLGELGAMLKKCALFLTTDSGPMHVGVSQGVPVVTMFGASPIPGFYPYDAKAVLLKSPEPCHPCGIHKCPWKGERNLACMKNITVEAVMQYVWELLDKYGNLAGNVPREYGKYKCRVIDLTARE